MQHVAECSSKHQVMLHQLVECPLRLEDTKGFSSLLCCIHSKLSPLWHTAGCVVKVERMSHVTYVWYLVPNVPGHEGPVVNR